MAEAYQGSESDEFPLVPGDYELVEVTQDSSEEYLKFCYALYGGGPSQEHTYKMYANADGKLMLFPRMEEEIEVWDYAYTSVLRKIRTKFQIGVPFKEMQDDCSTTDTTATLIHPDTILLTHHRDNGQVYTTKMRFKSTRMISTHEYSGVCAHRIWKRIVGGIVVEDLVRIGKRALRDALRRSHGETLPADSPGISSSGSDRSLDDLNYESRIESSDIVQSKAPRRDTPTPDYNFSGDEDNHTPVASISKPPPPPPSPPSSSMI